MRNRLPTSLPDAPGFLPVDAIDTSFVLNLAGRDYCIEGIPCGWRQLLPLRLLACSVKRMNGPGRTIKIQMSGKEHLRPVAEPHDLNETTHLHFSPTGVKLVSDWCEAGFQPAMDAPARLLVHRESSPWFCNVLENLLRVLVAFDVLQRGGVLLHCAAIVKDNRAVVMFGHSGAGKSTTSGVALANGCAVISDDINIIEPSENGWQVRPVPFSGTLDAITEITHPVPLHGLYRLNQSDSDHVEDCSPARSVSLLAGSAPFVNQDLHRSGQLVDILSTLCSEVVVRDLYFTHSGNFLQHIFPMDENYQS